MNEKIFFAILSCGIVLYFIITLINPLRELLRKRECVTPVKTYFDPALGEFKITYIGDDDWCWTTLIRVLDQDVVLQVEGDQMPHSDLIIFARKLQPITEENLSLIDTFSRKYLGLGLVQITRIMFTSNSSPHIATVQYLADDLKEYECTIDCSKGFEMFATPAPI